MNLGIRYTSRKPSNKIKPSHGSRTKGRSLDDIAESFGLDVSSLGDQAESMWSMLNDLHDSDPVAYNSYIQDQIEEMNNLDREKTIVPEKGFVVKAFMMIESDGTRKLKKMFINFCHHKAIEIPIDSNGDKVSETTENLVNAQIPMVISTLRDFTDTCGQDSHTIDVILNPWCLRRSSINKIFKSQVVSLGIKSIMEELKIEIHSKWKFIRSIYKGGIGKKKMDVHPFPLDIKTLKQKNDGWNTQSCNDFQDINSIMNDPQSLLQSLRDDKENQDDFFTMKKDEDVSNTKPILIQELNRKRDTKVSLIEEIDSNMNPDLGENTTSQTEKRKKSLSSQMKGFLNDKEKYKTIYEKPSTGDGTKGEGGTYSKLMSRCQVVDTINLVPTSSTVKDKKIKFATGMKKGFLNNSDNHLNQEKPQDGDFDAEFNKIMKKIDPSFAQSFNKTHEDTASVEEFKEAMKGLANGMEIQQKSDTFNVITDLNVPVEPEQKKDTQQEKRKQIPFAILSEEEDFTLNLDLDHTKVSKINNITVEINNSLLAVSTSCGWYLKYFHPNINDNVTAKFKRKTKKLSIKFSSKN